MNPLPLRLLLALVLLLSCSVAPTTVASPPPPTIVVVDLDAEDLAALKAAAPSARLIAARDTQEALPHMAKADALIGSASQELVKAGKKLRWVQVLSAGVDRYRYPALVDSDIVFTNAKVLQGPNVADQAMALLLVLTRKVYLAIQKRDWDRSAYRKDATNRPIELHNKRALVVGLGGIGTAIAQRSAGFGMKVHAIDIHPDKAKPDFVQQIHAPDQLHAQLALADVVFLAVPLTPQTTGMIAAPEFAALKKGSYLVNIARGKVIDTDAMLNALRDGTLAGAGLDVTDPEPLPPEHPLWQQANAVITPHLGGTSDQVWARKLEFLQGNLRRFVAGETLENIVDKKKGY